MSREAEGRGRQRPAVALEQLIVSWWTAPKAVFLSKSWSDIFTARCAESEVFGQFLLWGFLLTEALEKECQWFERILENALARGAIHRNFLDDQTSEGHPSHCFQTSGGLGPETRWPTLGGYIRFADIGGGRLRLFSNGMWRRSPSE